MRIRSYQPPELPGAQARNSVCFCAFQLEQTVSVLQVMSCDGAAALIWSSLALVSNGSLEPHSGEGKEQGGQRVVASREMCQLVSLQNRLP